MSRRTPPPDQQPGAWSDTAVKYEQVVTRITAPVAEATVGLLEVGPGDLVADVAAGTGAASILCAAKGARVVATDFSHEMVSLLREGSHAKSLGSVSACVMDGQRLALATDSFDVGVSVLGLVFFADRVEGFAELFRVLRSGGRAAVSGWGDPTLNQFLTVFTDAAVRVIPGFKPRIPAAFSLADEDVCRSEMVAGGFTKVDVGTCTVHMHLSDRADSYWDDWWDANPVLASFIRRNLDRRDELREAVTEIVTERYGGGPIEASGVAVIGLGEK